MIKGSRSHGYLTFGPFKKLATMYFFRINIYKKINLLTILDHYHRRGSKVKINIFDMSLIDGGRFHLVLRNY